jgi:hypothetical protein
MATASATNTKTPNDTQTTTNPDMTNSSATNIDYPYYKYIKTPGQLGMSSRGKDIGKNFSGLMSYVSVLVFGKSKASTTGGPLGNRFFVNSYSKCKDIKTDELVNRYIYIDNVPSGNLRLDMDISDEVNPSKNPDGSEQKTAGNAINTGMTGLVPGILEDITKINPITLFKELEDDTYPACHKVTLDTIDSSNVWGSETHYVSDNDLRWVDPCFFIDNVNVATNVKCKHPHRHVPPPTPPTPPPDESSTESESFKNPHLYTKSDELLCMLCTFYIIFVILYMILVIYYK